MNLHKLLFFYICIFIPLSFMIVLLKIELLSSNGFVVGLLIYSLLYHPFISGRRLVELQIIDKSKFLNNFIPFWNFKYFDILFFKS